MSGIFGFIGKKCNDNNCGRIITWNKLYGMAGTDVVNEGCFLGCCHERITDNAKREKPIIKRGSRTYVLDAVIYNRDELLERLHDGDGSISDEELLADYIEAFGPGQLKCVNGDFAGIIYDSDSKDIVLFRDHMGVRPLYYYADMDVLAFSTDIRGILSLDFVDTGVSERWISGLIKGYGTTSLTDTEYENIYCVKPGSYRRYSTAGHIGLISELTYWMPGSHKTRCRSRAEYQKKLRELVTDSVRRRLSVTTGKVGAELSGGLDSSVIDIIINRLGREGLYHSWSADPDVLSYVEKDERLAIGDICRQEGIECHFTDRIDAGGDSVAADNMRACGIEPVDTGNMELRFIFPPFVNTEYIMDGASYMNRHGVHTVFSGHAGDEGVSHRPNIYELFYHHEYYQYLRNMWRRSWRSKHRLYETLKMIKRNLFEAAPGFKAFYTEFWGDPELLAAEFAKKPVNAGRYPFYFAYDPKRYIMNGGSRNRLDNLALQGACCSVRYFIPYADYRLIDFAVTIPRYNYIMGEVNRYIFREAFRDIMPQSLYTLNVKSENSRAGEKRADDWFEKYKESKREIAGYLDEKLWGRYLSYDMIRKWLDAAEPPQDKEMDDIKILYLLTQCAKAQNALYMAKKV